MEQSASAISSSSSGACSEADEVDAKSKSITVNLRLSFVARKNDNESCKGEEKGLKEADEIEGKKGEQIQDDTFIRIAFPGLTETICTACLDKWIKKDDDCSYGVNFEFEASDEWALQTNEFPYLLLTIFKAGKWVTVREIDISRLFDGDTEVSRAWSDIDQCSMDLFRCVLSVNEGIFTEAQLKKFNPMSIHLRTVKNLPRVSKSLWRCCEAKYVRCDVPPGLLEKGRRAFYSEKFEQTGQEKLSIDSKIAILTGSIDANLVAEALETDFLRVRVHDRDVGLVTTERALRNFQHNLIPDIQESKPEERNSEVLADKRSWLEYMKIQDKHSEQQVCGESTISMNELLNASRELIERHRVDLYNYDPKTFGPNYKAAEVALEEVVAPRKRNIPSGGAVERAELDLDENEKSVRQPGRYLDTNTVVKVSASLMFPLFMHPKSVAAQRLKKAGQALRHRSGPFGRIIYMFRYRDAAKMRKIRTVLDDINRRALPHAESLRSYQLSETEQVKAHNAELDVVGGFHVIDADFRIIVLEGLAEGGIAEMLRRFPREGANTETAKILANQNVRFQKRIYTRFDVEPKLVRLRDPLCFILQSPAIYDSFRVDKYCRDALLFLSEIRSRKKAIQLYRAKCFPSADMLEILESKFGESITVEDIDGLESSLKNNQIEDAKEHGICTPTKNRSAKPLHSAQRRKAPTNTRNEAYLRSLDERHEKDFTSIHRELRLQAMAQAKEKIEKRQKEHEELREKFGPEVFRYSGQALNFAEKQQEAMRRRLAGHKHVTYTYSRELQSLTFPLINMDDIAPKEAEYRRSKFTTPQGFVYPAPRNAVESRRLRVELSDGRIEELREPWANPEVLAKQTRLQERGHGLPEFDCIPTHEHDEFGGFNSDGTKNPYFFQSVHIGGDCVQAEAEERKTKELQEWRQKLVVDTLHFKVSPGLKKPNQVDRFSDILKGQAKKRGIKLVRNSKLPSGKAVPLRRLPVSMFSPPKF